MLESGSITILCLIGLLESFSILGLRIRVTITRYSLVNLASAPSTLFTECFGHRLLFFFKHDSYHDHTDANGEDADINVPLEEEEFLAELLLSSNIIFFSWLVFLMMKMALMIIFFGKSFHNDTNNNDDNSIQIMSSTKPNHLSIK